MNAWKRSPVLLLTLAACAPANEPGWPGEVRDSAGIAIVENPAAGRWQRHDAWIAEPVLEIGASHGEDAYEFGNIKGVAVLDDGRIAVLDALAPHVRMFTPDGRALEGFGASGRGPGELSEYADALWREPGDTLVVVDMGSRSINRYLSDGRFVRGTRMPFEGSFTYSWKGDGTGLSFHNARRFEGQRSDTLESIEVRDAAGTHLRTVARYRGRVALEGDASSVRLTVFAPEILWTSGPGGRVWVGETHAYELRRYAANGSIDRIIRKPFTVRTVSEADKRFYLDAMVRLWQGRVNPRMRPQLRDATAFYETTPVFVDLRTGPAGTLWVQPFRGVDRMAVEERAGFDPERDLGGPAWDVFDDTGRYLGSVELPSRFTPALFRGASLYGVARDASDVQRVVRLDLRRADGGPIIDR